MTYNVILTICQNLSRPIIYRLLAISVGIVVIWQLISGVILISSLNRSTTTPEKLTVRIDRSTRQHSSNLGLTTAFFGRYVPENLNDADVKQSMLNLKVVGIMLSIPENDSQVIIHAANGHDQTYRVGDTLPGDVVIKRISRDGVLVERKGDLESLSFPENELIFEAPAKPLIEDKVNAF